VTKFKDPTLAILLAVGQPNLWQQTSWKCDLWSKCDQIQRSYLSHSFGCWTAEFVTTDKLEVWFMVKMLNAENCFGWSSSATVAGINWNLLLMVNCDLVYTVQQPWTINGLILQTPLYPTVIMVSVVRFLSGIFFPHQLAHDSPPPNGWINSKSFTIAAP
jgi:hypothetical protein